MAAIEELHDGAPVSAARIGSTVGIAHHQTLIYLQMAADEGRAKPVCTTRDDVTRGWVPEHIDASMSLTDERAALTAETLARLYQGKPLSERQVTKAMERPTGTVGRWLAHAKTMGLVVRAETHRGWIPQNY